jgi:hypothetical protein
MDYVEGVIKGTNAAANQSDANYDGKVDLQDLFSKLITPLIIFSVMQIAPLKPA